MKSRRDVWREQRYPEAGDTVHDHSAIPTTFWDILAATPLAQIAE